MSFEEFIGDVMAKAPVIDPGDISLLDEFIRQWIFFYSVVGNS
ncbi:hypothetical protein [Moorena producens]|nr:hypothetical protein [Moorena producens]